MARLLALLLVLAPSALGAIRGNLYDSYLAPVSGARVAAFRPATILDERLRIASGAPRQPVAVATSNDDGTFALDTKSSGMIELMIEAEGFAPKGYFALEGETDLAITLEHASTRVGRVTANGKPVANVLVVAGVDGLPFWTTKSNADGAFEVADAVTRAGLRFIHPDYAMHNATRSLDAELSRGTRVDGTVTRGGKPVSGAVIVIDGWPVATSGEDGTFTIAHANTDAPTIEAILGDERGSAKRADRIEIELARGRSISGTVRDAAKTPLAHAAVIAYTAAGEIFDAIADDDGNYRIGPLAANDYLVSVEKAGEIEFEKITARLRANETAKIDFNATKRIFIRGVIVDGEGKPVDGAYVSMDHSPDARRIYGLMGGGLMTRSGADGRFKYETNSNNYPVNLQVMHPDYALAFVEAPGAKPVIVTMQNGIEVHGTVVDAEGKPVAGAAIAARQNPSAEDKKTIEAELAHDAYLGALVSTDDEGRFVAHLNDAVHDIGVLKEGFGATTVNAIKPERGMQPLRIVLERGVEIRGRVTSKSPGAQLFGSIVAKSESGTEWVNATNKDGTFFFDGLRPGTYVLMFVNLQSQFAEKPVTAPARNVVLELTPRADSRR